jgi:hypothetical protein
MSTGVTIFPDPLTAGVKCGQVSDRGALLVGPGIPCRMPAALFFGAIREVVTTREGGRAVEEIMSTRQVAALLGISVAKLTREVWLGRIQAPQKSPAGDHLWGRKDDERACWMLRHQDLSVLLAEREAREGTPHAL